MHLYRRDWTAVNQGGSAGKLRSFQTEFGREREIPAQGLDTLPGVYLHSYESVTGSAVVGSRPWRALG